MGKEEVWSASLFRGHLIRNILVLYLYVSPIDKPDVDYGNWKMLIRPMMLSLYASDLAFRSKGPKTKRLPSTARGSNSPTGFTHRMMG